MNMQTREIRAMDIPKFGVFVWNNTLWGVVETECDGDATYIEAIQVASMWTANPYDRWQLAGLREPERFNGYCMVEELIHNLTEETQKLIASQQPAQPAEPTGEQA